MAYTSQSDTDRIQPTGLIAEFVEALRQEIRATRGTGKSVPLISGRRISRVGDACQYVFEIENVLSVPADSPADLKVPGQKPLRVTIVSVDGLTVTLSVTKNLDSFVPRASLQTDLAFLMERLIERLRSRAAAANPVGERILGAAPVSGVPQPIGPSKLNEEQTTAVASSLGRDATFIWGPPGTGKTRTIGAICGEFCRSNRSVLLVSHTNIAVDQALWQLSEYLTPDEVAGGRILRVGSPKDQRLEERPELLLQTHVKRRTAELQARLAELQTEQSAIDEELASLDRLIELAEWIQEAPDDIVSMQREHKQIRHLRERLLQARSEAAELAAMAESRETAAREARDLRDRLTRLPECGSELAELERRCKRLRHSVAQSAESLSAAELLYEETASIGRLRRLWRGLPSPQDQGQLVTELRARRDRFRRELDEWSARRDAIEDEQTSLRTLIERFRQRHSADPPAVIEQARLHAFQLQQKQAEVRRFAGTAASRQQELDVRLRGRLAVLQEWGLSETAGGLTDDMLAAISNAFQTASTQLVNRDLDEMRVRQLELKLRQSRLAAKIEGINQALKRVEDQIIAEAVVVGTTLTNAYLRDSINKRRFHTVVLDEASMAPIPALWAAANLADSNGVVVGDFRQLSPIVISQEDTAQQWLGRDIFKVAGMTSKPRPSHFVALRRQYRMHPDISCVPNELVYESELKDEPLTQEDGDLHEWYRADWGYDQPVLLVDTGPLNAWVTSVSRGSAASRLNFLSATVCVDIARQLLRDDRRELACGAAARILVVCPYQPHAQLVQLLVREQELDSEVIAGTTHSFQGSEADVVILDLVNDEPHWRVRMFDPKNDEDVQRLLNVAITRARRRLIVVGDFDYIQQKATKAFIGRKLVPLLKERYASVSAHDVVPAGFAARAAKARAGVFGGSLEADAPRIVVTQERFFPLLVEDLRRANSRVAIYSPFLTERGIDRVQLELRAAVERGVSVHIVTKALRDRNKGERSGYRDLERTLSSWGIVVIHKKAMHEKLVFVDDDVLWSGSLNPLSFSSTQEVMERRASHSIVQHYATVLRLADLLAGYAGGPPTCPCCGCEVIASEGRREPFYWRCVEKGCYSRKIDEPITTDGLIHCSRCGGDLEAGEWGGQPAWRCLQNRRHHQMIAATHLRLPRMRERISESMLRKLEGRLGTASADGADRSGKSNHRQGKLF